MRKRDLGWCPCCSQKPRQSRCGLCDPGDEGWGAAGCQHEELSESLCRCWLSLWQDGNCVGSDNGAGFGLPIHVLQPHTLGSVVKHNLPFGFLSLHSAPAFPSLAQYAENVSCDIWSNVSSDIWSERGYSQPAGHWEETIATPLCCSQTLLSEEVLTASIRLCAYMGLLRNWLYFPPSAGIKGNS